jgi:FPC/CPF motif-containing protein YcgG
MEHIVALVTPDRTPEPEAPPDDPLLDRDGNYCRVEDGRLWRPFHADSPSALTAFVHDSFKALALNDHFSCVGARSVVRQNAYRFGLYGHIGDPSSTASLAVDLRRFNADTLLQAHRLTAFVASFVQPAATSEGEFERLLWTTLQQLSDLDDRPWTPTRADDPENPKFGFSFAGTGFFVVGLHAGSSRMARRFPFPTLVFNPHAQFDRLRQDGHYTRFRDVVRARDVELQGTLNPMLRDFGEASEARQYSGRAVSPEWRCPFAHRADHSDGDR